MGREGTMRTKTGFDADVINIDGTSSVKPIKIEI